MVVPQVVSLAALVAFVWALPVLAQSAPPPWVVALQGGGHAVCAPTGVTAKIRVDPNQGALKADPRVDMRSVTRIEASHRGSK